MAAPSSPRVPHPRRWIVAAIVVAMLLAVVVVVFEPQTLFIDTRVDDAFPAAATPDPDAGVVPPSASEPAEAATTEPVDDAAATEAPAVAPVVLASGSFVDRDHPASGTASVFALDGGTRVLRFEDLATDNGPDLKVYLSAAGPDAPSGEFDDTFVDLGPLTGNLGNQNYEIPADVDLEQYASVVIWCDRFNVPFGASPLAPQRAG